MQTWFANHPIIAYIVIFVLLTYVYNQCIPSQPEAAHWQGNRALYHDGAGSGMLLIFQHDKLPIIQCLLVAVALMLLVRVRYFVEARQKRKRSRQAAKRP
jgi:hypothetical protein